MNLYTAVSLLVLIELSLIIVSGYRCKKLPRLNFKLFASKSTYNDARDFLKKVNATDLPESFGGDKLEKVDKKLRKDGCTPIVFYFVGRHSARFPDAEDIEKYEKDLTELIGKLGSTSAQFQCRRADYMNWSSKMQAKQDSLITYLGGCQERDIARRFKLLYTKFFNFSMTDIHIGVTKQMRTAQSGAEFLKEVTGLRLPGCNKRSLPTNDVHHKEYNIDNVLEADCYKYMSENLYAPFLEFHRMCEQIVGKRKIKDPLIDRAKNPNLMKPIADRVAHKLGLDNSDNDPPITPDVLDSIYNTCRFENALNARSIWCDLFEQRDLEALEYIEDVNLYIKGAYGPKANPKQSCPLVKELLRALHEGTRLTPKDKKRSYFYFTHAGPIQKMLVMFNLFRDDDSFSAKRISDFEQDLTVPKRRSWRTSFVAPFSANLVFIQYRCRKSLQKKPTFKILATVNEQPIKLGGCNSIDCDSDRFFSTYDYMANCDMNQICQEL